MGNSQKNISEFFKKNIYLIFLLAIIAAAIFLRLWKLDSIPPGLYPDVAINGNNALETLRTGNFKVFYPENNGREGLFMWLISFSFLLFGPSVWSIKIVAALIGILTIIGLYLLTKELFVQSTGDEDKRKAEIIALLSAFLLATSFWHISFSRIGFRMIFIPFILVFGFYFLFKGLKSQKLSAMIISGIFFGLGFYTYISYRFVVFLLPLTLFLWWLAYNKQKQVKQFLKFVVFCLVFAGAVALPLGIYFLGHLGDFTGRTAGVSIFGQENPLKAFAISLTAHLAMFNVYGDANWRHNFSGASMLPFSVGILFLMGFFASIKEIKNSIKNKNNPSFIVHSFLIAWFFIMLLPGILTYEGIPHALRVVGVIPVVYMFAALGGIHIYSWFYKNVKNKKLLVLASVLFLIMTAAGQFDKYFFKWGARNEVKGAFAVDFVEIGNYLNSLRSEDQKYVIVNQGGVLVNGIPMPAQTPMFIESAKFGQPRAIYLLPKNLDQIKIRENTTIVLMQYDGKILGRLISMFPGGKIQEKNGIWIYKIN